MKIAFSHGGASPDGPIRVANGRPIRRRLEPVMRDLNEFTITSEVLRRIENTPDPRLHEILASAIRHLHDFARETKLTEAEWMEGITFLTRTRSEEHTSELQSPMRTSSAVFCSKKQ